MLHQITITTTKQYGPAVTVYWSLDSDTTYNLDGKYSHGDIPPNYLNGRYLLTDSDRQQINTAIASVATTGLPITISFDDGRQLPAKEPEWLSQRGLTLTEEMGRDDTIY